jgi:hypothetical protein
MNACAAFRGDVLEIVTDVLAGARRRGAAEALVKFALTAY